MPALIFLLVVTSPFDGYLQALHPQATKVVGGLVVLGWGIGLLRGRAARLHGPVPIAVGALLVVLLVSLFLHPDNTDGLEVTTRYLAFLLLTLVIIDAVRSGVDVRLVGRAYVIGTTAASIAATVTFVVSDAGRATGPLADPNDLAFFFATAIPIAVALRGDARLPNLYDLSVLILLGGTAATLSRGGILAIMAAFGLAFLAGRVRLWAVAGLMALGGVALAVLPMVLGTTLETSLRYKDNVASSNVDERLVRWEAAARMTADAPLVGLGPAGFRESYPTYVDRLPENALEPLDVSHNMYLEVSSELGLLGLAAFIAVIAYGAAGAWRRWRADGMPLALGVLIATVSGLIAAMFLTQQYYLPLWLFAALGAALDPDPAPDGLPAAPDRRTAEVV